MTREEDLEKRVETLEGQLAAMKRGAFRGVRKRSSWGLGDLPFYEVALGPDPDRGELRGHAKAVIAIGDMATGLLALGGWARGGIAIGGLATGLISLGGASIGVILAVGGLAIGGAAFGGGAIGGIAVGGGAYGYYACGGGAAGEHVVSATRRDPEALRFFRENGLSGACPTEQSRPRRW